jgi:hypothetical protein
MLKTKERSEKQTENKAENRREVAPGSRQSNRKHCLASDRVVLSFGMGIPSSRRSFRRKRESTPDTLGNVLSPDWVPAFAEMTAPARMTAHRMTPVPTMVGRGPAHPFGGSPGLEWGRGVGRLDRRHRSRDATLDAFRGYTYGIYDKIKSGFN